MSWSEVAKVFDAKVFTGGVLALWAAWAARRWQRTESRSGHLRQAYEDYLMAAAALLRCCQGLFELSRKIDETRHNIEAASGIMDHVERTTKELEKATPSEVAAEERAALRENFQAAKRAMKATGADIDRLKETFAISRTESLEAAQIMDRKFLALHLLENKKKRYDLLVAAHKAPKIELAGDHVKFEKEIDEYWEGVSKLRNYLRGAFS